MRKIAGVFLFLFICLVPFALSDPIGNSTGENNTTSMNTTLPECTDWQINHPEWYWCQDFENLSNCEDGTENSCWQDNGFNGAPAGNLGGGSPLPRENRFKIVSGSDAAEGTGYVLGEAQPGSTGAGYVYGGLPQGYQSINLRYYWKNGQGRFTFPGGHGPGIHGHGDNECVMRTTLEIGSNPGRPGGYYIYRTNSCYADMYTNVFAPNQPSPPLIYNDHWYLVEMQFVTDTACSDPTDWYGCNGIIRLWIDEQLVMEYTNVNHGGAEHNVLWDAVQLRNYFHHLSPYYYDDPYQSGEELLFDNFVISNGSYIGPAENENDRGEYDLESPYILYVGVEPFVGHRPADDCSVYSAPAGSTWGTNWRNANMVHGQTLLTRPNGFPDSCTTDPDGAMLVNVTSSGQGAGLGYEKYSDNMFLDLSFRTKLALHGWMYLPSTNDYSGTVVLSGFSSASGSDVINTLTGMAIENGNWALAQRGSSSVETVATSTTPVLFDQWNEFEIMLYDDQTASVMINEERVFEKESLPYPVDRYFTHNYYSWIVTGVIQFEGTPPFEAYYDDTAAGSASFWSCDGWGSSCPFTNNETNTTTEPPIICTLPYDEDPCDCVTPTELINTITHWYTNDITVDTLITTITSWRNALTC